MLAQRKFARLAIVGPTYFPYIGPTLAGILKAPCAQNFSWHKILWHFGSNDLYRSSSACATNVDCVFSAKYCTGSPVCVYGYEFSHFYDGRVFW